jgi:hypothetical protein
MNRLLKLHVDEIAVDPEGASALLNSACAHARSMRLTGCCQTGGVLIVTYEECAAPSRLKHLFAPFADPSEEGLIAEIDARYMAGFTTVGSIDVHGRLWGLFSYEPNAPAIHPAD